MTPDSPYVTANLRPASNGHELDIAVLVGVSDDENKELVGLVETTLQEIPGSWWRDPVGDFVVASSAWPRLYRVLMRAGVAVVAGVGCE